MDNTKKNSNVPNLRFTNTKFNTYKIGDLSTVVTGGTPSTKISNYWDGDIPWMPSGDIHKKYIFNYR